MFAPGEAGACEAAAAQRLTTVLPHHCGAGALSLEAAHRASQGLRMVDIRAPIQRPLSPHLQIYRFMLTMMMSIVHRITGAALYFGTLLLAWWLIAAAAGPNAYANV